jgi:hypothetical protein
VTLLDALCDAGLIRPVMADLRRSQTDCLARFDELVGPRQSRADMVRARDAARAAVA